MTNDHDFLTYMEIEMENNISRYDSDGIGVSLGHEPEEDWACYWLQVRGLHPVAGLKTKPPEGNWYADEARAKFVENGASVGVALTYAKLLELRDMITCLEGAVSSGASFDDFDTLWRRHPACRKPCPTSD